MNTRYLSILIASLHAGPAAAENDSTGPLTIAAATPVISVSRHPPGRYFLSPPTLEYAFDVGAHCDDVGTPRSVSITVADSRLTLSASDLDGNGLHQVLLTIPARQIAPIAIDNFCVFGPNDAISIVEPEIVSTVPVAEPDRVTVGAALSAHVSLLCSDENEQKITYVTRPLDVTLACEAVLTTDAVPGQTSPADR
ncbi:MAG: hypothetical protein ACREQ8_09450 [Woeseiaceae bacterium]